MCSASLGQLSSGKASEQEARLQALAAHRLVHPAPAQHLVENKLRQNLGQNEQSWETGDGGWLGGWGEMEIWLESIALYIYHIADDVEMKTKSIP